MVGGSSRGGGGGICPDGARRHSGHSGHGRRRSGRSEHGRRSSRPRGAVLHHFTSSTFSFELNFAIICNFREAVEVLLSVYFLKM